MKVMRKMFLLIGVILILSMTSATSVRAASDLKIDVLDKYVINTDDEIEIPINFSGVGIASVSAVLSGNGLSANINNVTWKAYPEVCTAFITVSTASSFVDGTITFQLVDDYGNTIKSHNIKIEASKPASQIYDLNINSAEFYSVEKGGSKKIEIKFSGAGIAGVNMVAEGDGFSASCSDIVWKAYPEECTTYINIKTTDTCTGGKLEFQLIGDDSSVIKSKSIQIKTYVKEPEAVRVELKEKKIPKGFYIIHSKLDDTKVIDISEVSMKDRAQAHLWSNYMNHNQIYYISPTKDGYYYITAVHSGMNLDVADGSCKNSTKVWQYTKNESDAQKWKFYSAQNNYVYISPKCAQNTFLDAAGGKSDNGTKLQIYEANYTDAQMWKCELVGKQISDIEPITFSGSLMIECETSISGSSTVRDGLLDDFKDALAEKINKKVVTDIYNLQAFVGEIKTVKDAIKMVSIRADSVEVPQSVSILMRQKNFKELNGLTYTVEDGDTRITYNIYVYPVYKTYSFAIFETTEKKSWGEWEFSYFKMMGGQCATIQ